MAKAYNFFRKLFTSPLHALLLVLLLCLAIPLGVSLGQNRQSFQSVTPAFVFLGWLDTAEVVTIHFLNGGSIRYSGEKLKRVRKELSDALKALDEKDKREGRKR